MRNQKVNRAIDPRQRGIRRATAVIVVLGVLGIVWAWNTPDRRRARLAGGVHIGDDSARIAEVMRTRGVACPTGGLAHLRDRFPAGYAPAAQEELLARMVRETAQRRVIPLRSEGGGCVPARGDTELGIGRDGRVLWMVEATGRTPVRLPDALAVPQPLEAGPLEAGPLEVGDA
jgi:hypothetical protein